MTAVSPLILVVDDDRSVRKSLTRLLTSAGYTVEAFASAREFLARPPHPGPCCLVLDVRMPGLSGLDLQDALASAGRRMSIVFVTGHGDISMSVKAMKGGAVDFRTLSLQPRPFLGTNGFQLDYLDGRGASTTDLSAIKNIRFRVQGVSAEAVRSGSGEALRPEDSLTTQVALRNATWP